MIRYALICDDAHEYEAWFAGSEAFDEQAKAGLVECPVCGSTAVSKQIMAPAISPQTRAKGEMGAKLAAMAAKMRNHIRDTHVYVGDKFADEARAMHAGEKDEAPIYGEATREEAEALRDDGVPAAPLPLGLAPVPPKKLN